MKKLLEFLITRMGYDHYLLWNESDRFKITKRMDNGSEKYVMNTKEHMQWFILYKNGHYETVFQV